MPSAQSADDSTLTRSTRWDSSWPKFLSPGDRQEILDYWAERFGVPPAAFCPFAMVASSRTIYLVRASGHLPRIADLRIQNAGLSFIRRVSGHLKPTTWAVQRFGHLARRAVADLSRDELRSLCQKGEIPKEMDLEDGFVILKTRDGVWGCGLFLAPDRLLCRLPKNLLQSVLACPTMNPPGPAAPTDRAARPDQPQEGP